jgi:transposase InsO family protein
MNTWKSLRFVEGARDFTPFDFRTIQSDHGPEFSLWFTKRIMERGMAHRHSRIRAPNNSVHLERFNRTIQEECIARIPRNIRAWRMEVPEYLGYCSTQSALTHKKGNFRGVGNKSLPHNLIFSYFGYLNY